jgi:hypothetical protein
MQLFVFPDELIALLIARCDRLGLVATVYEPPLKRDRPGWTGDLRQVPIDWGRGAECEPRIMLHPPADGPTPRWGEVVSARLGWVDVRVGNLRMDGSDRILEVSSIDAKSDYIQDGIMFEDPRSLHLHRRITRPIKAALRRPMQAWNNVYGGERTYSDIYFSDRTAAFFHDGGELMQAGVSNVRFRPTDEI